MELRKAFNEDTRVKFPATIHLLRLGYKYRSFNDAIKNGLIDFNTKIFVDSFLESINRINKTNLSKEQSQEIINKIDVLMNKKDLGKEFYLWLIKPNDKLKLIDFDHIENNTFEVVNELRFSDEKSHFRPDINILINGMPLSFLEVKHPNNEGGIKAEFTRMVDERLKEERYKKFFNLIQLVCFSNNMPYERDDERGMEPKQGSFYATPNGFHTEFNFFREESSDSVSLLEDDDDIIKNLLIDNGYDPSVMETQEYLTNIAVNTPCNSFCTSFFRKDRILYFLRYGILYCNNAIPEKHIMRYPQFFASQAILRRLSAGGKSGIIWHTQGSGKTELSVYANRIITDYYAKKNINTRFFYVVDRIELLNQTKSEFEKRDIEAVGVDSRDEFAAELQRALDKKANQTALGSCVVVNIQKFSDSLPTIRNDYNANIQRIIYVDEAHRSYSKGTGEFYKNLMLMDRDAIFIAMTGTPLLSKKERSNLRFGEYIHKYFYDRSILDGYTLKIKKEEMETITKSDIKRNLELELRNVGKKQKAKILESDTYITALGKYIEDDFKNFRYTNGDNSIGAMIVCNSNPQAAKMQTWFEKNSDLNTRLVTDDVPSSINKETQKDFKEAKNGVDILIVNLMLTTGYDVKRLKKMYLLRIPHQHSLLQTISRVNRPYKSPDGKVYQYGYISDFVDITEEYDRTVAQYLKELNDELYDPDDPVNIAQSSLVVDINVIDTKYKDALSKLNNIFKHDNLEEYNNFLQSVEKKEPLYNLRKLVNTILDCKTEFLLSRADDKAKEIDKYHYKELAKLIQHRIDFLNIQTDPVNTLDFLSENEVVEIIYKFVKLRTITLELKTIRAPEDIKLKLEHLVHSVKELKNRDDDRVVKLDEFLKKIFEKLSFNDVRDFNELERGILEAIKEAEDITKENKKLVKEFNNEFAYVKTFQDCRKNKSELNEEALIELLKVVSDSVKEIKSINKLVLVGRSNFINNVKSKVSVELLKRGLYKKLNLNENFDSLLEDLFVNLQLY